MKQMMDPFYSLQFNPRSLCPVCGSRKWQGCTCTVCGYEASRDYSTWRTLTEIPAGTESLEARQDKRKREEEEKQRAAIIVELTEVYDEKLQAEGRKRGKLQREHESLQENHDILQKKYESLQANYKVLQNTRDGLRKECADRSSERIKLREEYGVLDKKYGELLNTYRDLQKQNEKLQDSDLVKQKKSFLGQLFGAGTQETAKPEVSIQTSSSGQRNVLRDQLRIQLSSGADEIILGRYPQSADGRVSPIQWQVLNRSEKGVLVISKYILDSKIYDANGRSSAVWENSDIRRWLENEFKSQAFNENELGYIQTVKNENSVTGWYVGRKTEEQIFLLSRREVETYLPDSGTRICRGTGYAVESGLKRNYSGDWWWLRSAGLSGGTAMYVNDLGTVVSDGYSVLYRNVGVRPALWLHL